MNHQDHVRLIAGGITPGGVWADLGSGEGAFTLALRDVAGPDIEISSIDQDRRSLRVQQDAFARHFPGSRVDFVQADFTEPLELPPLDGILAANSLHYVRDKATLLRRLRGYLKPTGRLLVVEYNADQGNPWVPHPFSFATFGSLARAAGYREPTLIATVPSWFLREIYSAWTISSS